MKAISALIAAGLTIVSLAAPSINRGPTIWAQSAVSVLKTNALALYDVNLDLYKKKDMFEGASLDCVIPPPPDQYAAPSVCLEADQQTSAAIENVGLYWQYLAKQMFPTAFGLEDNSDKPRASYSDFSHFYNHFLLEIETLQNITAYFACTGNLRTNSLTWIAEDIAFYNSTDLLMVENGPSTATGPGTNGTLLAYPKDGHFIKSIQLNTDRMSVGWGAIRALMSEDTAACDGIKAAGLAPPRLPKDLP